MRTDILRDWLRYSWATRFFSDFDSWRKIAKDRPLFSADWAAMLSERDDSSLQQEYDDLLKGTNAGIYIPLWASVCKFEDGSLLDETTLKVIQFYHKWGYAPVNMDGNPPDYIGQQTRFLAYLLACAAGEEARGESPSPYLEAAEEFTTLYLLDTVRVVSHGLRQSSEAPVFRAVADSLVKLVQGEGEESLAEKLPEKLFDILECFGAFQTGPLPAIHDGTPRVVRTGGRNNCGGKCSIHATVQDGCITGVETGCDIGAPELRACVRGRGYRKTYFSGQRLRYPMKRIGERGEGRFQRISWDEAADIITSEWKRITAAYGPGSRYVNYGLGVNAVIRPDMLIKRLLNMDGGYLGFYGSYSFHCAQFVTPYIYGDAFSGNSVEDLLNTKLLILWAHNPSETVYSPQGNYFIAQAKERGAKVIVIDPRESDTVAAIADQWVPIRPSTDGALAAAMAYVIWSEGLQDQHFMDTYCQGFDAAHMPEGVPQELNFYNYLFGRLDGVRKDPAWAEEITGIPAETIAALAREYAITKPACILPGLGNQRIGNGEQTVRAMAMLACLTGNAGIPGGGAAGMGFGREEAPPVFPMGTSEYPGVISCFLWTRAIEEGKNMTRQDDGVQGMERLESNIKLMFNLGSNTLINQHADINNSIRILKDTSKLEFLVCTDVFMTPSAKFADLLLPAPSFLEDDDIAAPWRLGHYLLRNNKVVEPLFGCRTEYDWLSDVAKRLDLWEVWSEGRKTQGEWLEYLYNELRAKTPELPDYETFSQNGGYTYRNAKPYIAYADQIRDPEHCKFATPSGKIEIFSKRLYDLGNPAEIPAIPSYVPCPEGPADKLREVFPLQLIGWHTKRRCHSIHDNNPWMEEVEPQRMWMHPADAEVRDITSGDIVEVYNNRGRLRIPVTVTTRVIQGVVAIPEGAWYTPGEDGVDQRGSINVLTSTHPTPLAKGNPQHTNLVEVRRA